MSESDREEILAYSDDRTVTLNTHRIIQETTKSQSQIMLEDFVNTELAKAHIGRYKTITVTFGIIIFILLLAKLYIRIYGYPDIRIAHMSLVILTGYNILSEKFNYIQFRVSSFGNRSIKAFLQKLDLQNNNVKNEKQKPI